MGTTKIGYLLMLSRKNMGFLGLCGNNTGGNIGIMENQMETTIIGCIYIRVF